MGKTEKYIKDMLPPDNINSEKLRHTIWQRIRTEDQPKTSKWYAAKLGLTMATVFTIISLIVFQSITPLSSPIQNGTINSPTTVITSTASTPTANSVTSSTSPSKPTKVFDISAEIDGLRSEIANELGSLNSTSDFPEIEAI